ncbi:metalloregulator ArsR/SmtB family transcription factor [Paracoccus litorisediminis]|jgi:DNA-binding transcriptional ArsR family regulator|uniref:Metalloregulator ArsR/SmtB family transcription factor n=1 Tax=Paracoccus litorisediminis TaxID=2006130 RepID=A0A844HED5_9RHOB|nr:metalloregulator ArsR/SmtB family transcription factor [Paracoccus litorisediminis]MTH57620.1 metalloregulator ArsR/SmtB family transcription factor [Paracoccus litorisediminis]
MEERQALVAFGALSQETRLRILRLLVVAGPEGLAAGVIAEQAGVSASNVSFHAKELERAGLICSRRESRSILYSIDFDALNGLVRFLMEDCCAGQVGPCTDTAVPACGSI